MRFFIYGSYSNKQTKGKFNNNNYAYLYNGEGKKDEDELLLNNNGPNSLPEKSMVCWNCLSILTVKPTWGIVQCPNCDKFNRVPDCDEGEKTRIKFEEQNKIRNSKNAI